MTPINILMKESNAQNPQFRPVCGFQSPFIANAQMLEIITADAKTADTFDMIYDGNAVEVYRIFTQKRTAHIKMFDIKFIAVKKGYDEWLVCQGLIAVSDISKVYLHERQGKKMLIASIYSHWNIDLRRRGT